MNFKTRWKHMTGSTKPTLALAMMTLLFAASCTTTPSGTAVDRLKQPAANHARALAGDDPAEIRKTGFVVLSLLEAYAGW